MNEEDRTVMHLLHGSADAAGSAWLYDTAEATGSQPTGFAAELVSLGYIKSALWRGRSFWCALAIIGLVIGIGYKVKYPTQYQANTTILLPLDANNDGAINSDVAIAQSRAVASLAVHELGLMESPASFAEHYTITPPTTDEVMVITATAASSQAALSDANAVATAFLKFRANLENKDRDIAVSSLALQASRARQQVQLLTKQIADSSGRTSTAASQATLTSLQNRLGQANDALTNADSDIRTIDQQTTLQNKDSQVLDTAYLLPRSRKKPVLLAAAMGLFGGLVLGVGILAVRAVVSDRLRRRDDVAHALGAPVTLSVGAIRLRRWTPFRGHPAASRSAAVRLVVAQLRATIPQGPRKPLALAVVPIDDPRAAAVCVASLATSCAQDGMRVVLADLARGAPAARLFGVKRPGVAKTGERGAHLVVSMPDPADPAPIGPWRGPGAFAHAEPTREVAEVCAGADLLLVLATLDPALGGDHLATWVSDAVPVVTAGRSSWTKIHAVAEMLRLAQVELASAVLVGTDTSDDSIGVLRPEVDGSDELPQQGIADPLRG